MKYEAPTLTRLGTITALTASDIKCTPGTDQSGLSHPWFARHDPATPGEEWDLFRSNGTVKETIRPAEFARRLTTGGCDGVDAGPHPVTGL